MKYIEKKYQQLIQDIESAYDNTCDTLKYHINELQKIISEKDEEIEKLKGASQLHKEIDEYNRLEAQNNINLDKPVKADAVVHHCGEGDPKVYKPGAHKRRSKTVVVRCKDCGAYFQAKSKTAKYCSGCRDKRAKASRAKWLAKQK